MRPSQTTRRLLSYFRPYRARLVFAVLLMALQAIIPGVLVLLIETVLDDVLIAKDHRALALMPFAVVGLYLLGGILRVGRGMLTRHIAPRCRPCRSETRQFVGADRERVHRQFRQACLRIR